MSDRDGTAVGRYDGRHHVKGVLLTFFLLFILLPALELIDRLMKFRRWLRGWLA